MLSPVSLVGTTAGVEYSPGEDWNVAYFVATQRNDERLQILQEAVNSLVPLPVHNFRAEVPHDNQPHGAIRGSYPSPASKNRG
jgi:hypothetical protein